MEKQKYDLKYRRKEAIKAVMEAPDDWLVTLEQERRSAMQNRYLWAALHDISKQKKWCGMTMEAEDWKHLFTAALAGQRFTQGLHGGVVVLGTSTSKMSKEQMSELLESIVAWGVENGVKFSDYEYGSEKD
jgi:hypothetical protein